MSGKATEMKLGDRKLPASPWPASRPVHTNSHLATSPYGTANGRGFLLDDPLDPQLVLFRFRLHATHCNSRADFNQSGVCDGYGLPAGAFGCRQQRHYSPIAGSG
jgi:hypothetical protein